MLKAAETMKVRLTLTEEILGMMPSNEKVYEEYIASNAPDQLTMQEEIEENGIEEVAAKGRTVFPRLEDGTPFLWDYQIRGMFKDSMGMLRRMPGSASSKRKAYKKEVDGLIFVAPRKIPIHMDGGQKGICERPLRASTPQGERVALASSETCPEGSYLEFTIQLLDPGLRAVVEECLDYGILRGLGQWRNSGKGTFLWEEVQ